MNAVNIRNATNVEIDQTQSSAKIGSSKRKSQEAFSSEEEEKDEEMGSRSSISIILFLFELFKNSSF